MNREFIHILRWGCDRQHNFSLLPGKRFRKLPSVHEATGQPLANFHYDREQEPAPPHETFVSCMCLRPVGLTLRYVKRSPILDTLPPANVHSMQSANVVAYLPAISVGLAPLLTIHNTFSR